jgi:GNAT superfamily N-acetyltransferase
MTPTTIRPVEPSDLPGLLALLRAKAAFDGSPDTLRATVESLRDALFRPAPLAHALVAEVEGRLVGMATYYAIFSSFIAKPGLWLDDLYVEEDARGQGIGQALMEQLCGVAMRGGCCRVDWHVSAFNPRGIAFYRRIGASVSEKSRLVRLDEAAIRQLAQGGA